MPGEQRRCRSATRRSPAGSLARPRLDTACTTVRNSPRIASAAIDRRDVVPVRARAQKRAVVARRRSFARRSSKRARDSDLGQRGRRRRARRASATRVGDAHELVERADADGVEHLRRCRAAVCGVYTQGTARYARDQLVVRRPREQVRASRPRRRACTLKSQPPPNGSRLTGAGSSSSAALTSTTSPPIGVKMIGDGLHRFDDADVPELLRPRCRRRGSST